MAEQLQESNSDRAAMKDRRRERATAREQQRPSEGEREREKDLVHLQHLLHWRNVKLQLLLWRKHLSLIGSIAVIIGAIAIIAVLLNDIVVILGHASNRALIVLRATAVRGHRHLVLRAMAVLGHTSSRALIVLMATVAFSLCSTTSIRVCM